MSIQNALKVSAPAKAVSSRFAEKRGLDRFTSYSILSIHYSSFDPLVFFKLLNKHYLFLGIPCHYPCRGLRDGR